MKKRKPQPSPVEVVFRRSPRGAGWSWADAMRAMERNAESEKAGPENEAADTKNRFPHLRAKRANYFPATTTWGWKGSSIGVGRGLWGKQTRLFLFGEAAALARTMPASWRADCHATRAVACRRGTAGSNQRDSEAAGLHTTPYCAYLYSSAEAAHE